jgi:hypothetical protein
MIPALQFNVIIYLLKILFIYGGNSMLQKPYKRMYRPYRDYIQSYDINEDYILIENYASDRISLCKAFHLILKDLAELLEYIEPCHTNIKTYSHRIYELFLRVATEFEANCKAVLKSNDYKGKNFTINTYHNLEVPLKLSEYRVKYTFWHGEENYKEYITQPFVWLPYKNGEETRFKLDWYNEYNIVKHDRSINFSLACLDNLLKSIAGLFCILYSQFHFRVFPNYNSIHGSPSKIIPFADENDFMYVDNSFISIKVPTSWTNDEKYSFCWDTLKNTDEPFDKYF